MSVDEIVSRAIPISMRECSINRAQKERMRKELKARIEEYAKAYAAQEQLKQVSY